MNYARSALALAVLAATSTLAADITFTPPAAGGFTVTKPASAATRFRIGETGTSQLFVDSNSGFTVKSANGFAVLDLDALDGNSGLRYFKNGVANWNVRNRPADDYLEWFEAPGGPRMVIQKGTGNVGIGETTNPTYKLDVLHGGSMGIRSRSSGSFSVVDIDAASGDAALRFAKAGVNQWNVRNRPADDYFEIFELGGGGSRFVIQDATGNVGIGETTSPSYKLDVLHGGSTGLRVRSSSSFSVIDLDAASGDAAIRFANAGVNQWNLRNQPGTDNLQVFELGGGGERLRIENTTGNVVVGTNFTAGGTKAFTIDHPLDPENRTLSHAAIESPEVLNAYSGNVTTDSQGRATVALPEYFETINRDYRYQLTAVGVFAQAIVAREIAGNSFEIATSLPNVKVSWEVKGVRSDARMKVDPFVAVKEKPAAMKGRYLDAKSWGQPASKSAVHDASGGGSTTYTAPMSRPAAYGAAAEGISSVSDVR